MNNPGTYATDAMILEKLLSGRWIAEPSTGKIYSKEIGKYLRQNQTEKGYLAVSLANTQVCVSRVIWIAVHGIPEITTLEVDHINENKHDNRIDNLQLLTNRGNARKSRAKITYQEAEDIRRIYAAGGISQRALGKQYNVSKTCISEIIRYEGHKTPPFIANIPEETKKNIFRDICGKGLTIKRVTEKYHVTPETIVATVEEQSLKIELTRRKHK